MFFDDAGVLDRHLPAAELDHPAACFQVQSVEVCALERGSRRRCIAHGILLRMVFWLLLFYKRDQRRLCGGEDRHGSFILPNNGIVTVSYRGKGWLSSKALERQQQQRYLHLVSGQAAVVSEERHIIDARFQPPDRFVFIGQDDDGAQPVQQFRRRWLCPKETLPKQVLYRVDLGLACQALLKRA